MSTLQKLYANNFAAVKNKNLIIKSAMQVPRITKIVLNMGVGEALADKKILTHALDDMTRISGQKPVIYNRQQIHRRF